MKLLFLFLMPVICFAKVRTEKIVYEKNGTKMEGLMAWNDKFKKPMPGVLVFHEWMGEGPFSENKARELAELGYVAFAADIYGQGIRPKDPKEAGALAGKYKNDRPLMRERAQAAYETLMKDKHVAKERIAAIGFCFGGTA